MLPSRKNHCPHPGLLLAILLVLLGPGQVQAQAQTKDLVIGLGLDPLEDDFLAREWLWALRGGGARFRTLDGEALAAPGPDSEIALLVLDSVPLRRDAWERIAAWVARGGLLVYAGAAAASEAISADGQRLGRRGVVAPELLGVRFAGFDPGLRGTYPYLVEAAPLLSPLLPGDGLRLGLAGVDHEIRLEAAGARVLARSARLSPGPGATVLKSDAPSVFLNRHGQGTVVFLSFSPGQVAACYPRFRHDREPRDCSGAGSAHALMRWLAANLLWEGRRLQLPLLFEAPGDRPHVVIATGDVHEQPDDSEIKAAVRMAGIFDRLGLPLSYYLVGNLARHAPAEVGRLREFRDLEISSHSATGQGYTAREFQPLGALGMLADLRAAQADLAIPEAPGGRGWLLSTRNHGWRSDEGAWRAMRRGGIGLVFDQVADRLPHDPPWKMTEAWFEGGERERLFVPIYEHSVVTGAHPFPSASHRLPEDAQADIALLASAQPEPCCQPMAYRKYSDYVTRWHRLFDRLATLGGLTEVWLWHPGGVANKNAYDEVERVLREFQREASVGFARGDVAASWRANRERYRVQVARDPALAITGIGLAGPDPAPVALPPGAPALAAATGYWVIGPLTVPGWAARNWTDPYGRTITVLTHPLK